MQKVRRMQPTAGDFHKPTQRLRQSQVRQRPHALDERAGRAGGGLVADMEKHMDDCPAHPEEQE